MIFGKSECLSNIISDDDARCSFWVLYILNLDQSSQKVKSKLEDDIRRANNAYLSEFQLLQRFCCFIFSPAIEMLIF